MNKINFHFIASGAFALCAVALSIFTTLSLPIAIFLELAPLVWYFSRLLRVARHDSLGQTAIDSIYYFGFLITIFSLAASVFRVWIYGVGNDISALISHFGVGLLATGLALAFRMWLTAISDQLSKKDLDEVIEDYIRRVDDVVSKVEMSAASFEGLSNSLLERTETVVSGASSAFEEAMVGSTKNFRDNLESITREAAGAIHLFSATVKEVSVTQHVVAFDRDMQMLSDGIRGVIGEISLFGKQLAEDAHKETVKALENTVSAHVNGLAVLTAQSKSAMDEILSSVDELDFADDAAVIREHMQALSTTVNNITKKFGTLEEKIENAAVRQSAETVRLVVDGFANDFKVISSMIEDEALDRVQAIMKNIAVETSASVVAVNGAAQKQVFSEISTLSNNLALAMESISKLGLIDHVTKFASAAEDAQLALSESASEFRRVTDEMKDLEDRIFAINPEVSVESARASIDELTEAIQLCEAAVRTVTSNVLEVTTTQFRMPVTTMSKTRDEIGAESGAELSTLFAAHKR